MAGRNKHLDNVIPRLYQRHTIDIMAFTFIDTYKLLFPSVTIKEAALAFMSRYNISEELHTAESVVITYTRVNKDLIDAQKTKT